MKHSSFPLLYASLMLPSLAHAVVQSSTGLLIDGAMNTIATWLTLGLIPLLLIFGLVKCIYTVLNGHQWGPYTGRLIGAGLLGTAGVGGIVKIFGGSGVSSLLF